MPNTFSTSAGDDNLVFLIYCDVMPPLKIQADLGDIAGLVPDNRNKVTIAIKQAT